MASDELVFGDIGATFYRHRNSRSYPLTSPLEYRTAGIAIDGKHGAFETGTGRTVTMSSVLVVFEADRALRAGEFVILSIAWPYR